MNFLWKKAPLPQHKERLIVKTVELQPQKIIAIHSKPIEIPSASFTPVVENAITEAVVEDIPIAAPSQPLPPEPKEKNLPPKTEVASNETKPAPKKTTTLSNPLKKSSKAVDKQKVPKKEIKKTKEPNKKQDIKVTPSPSKKKKDESPKVKQKLPAVVAKKAEPKGPTEEEKRFEAERKAQAAKQMQLIAKAKESIAKVDTSNARVATNGPLIAMPSFSSVKSIENLQIDALPGTDQGPLSSLSDPETNYISELRHRLELMLKLPDRGDVKILLTLNRSGNVDQLKIVNSKSEANKNYVETKIPKITFTNFGTNFANYDKYTFQITLKNQ